MGISSVTETEINTSFACFGKASPSTKFSKLGIGGRERNLLSKGLFGESFLNPSEYKLSK